MTPYDLDRVMREADLDLSLDTITKTDAIYRLLRALIKHSHDVECDRQLALHHEREASRIPPVRTGADHG